MKQQDLYLKDISRHIEGVIKADDEEYIIDEVNEYVITKEIEKHIGLFFSEYVKRNYNDSVWISGFFGSGKSHMLKMLSLVLENKTIGEHKCGEIFASKIKDDFELNGNIKKSIAIPTKTILFNIAQKADGIGNLSGTDPILSVFLKVFNEFLGYNGQSPAIAEIERHLDEEGLYDKFKELYQKENNKDWYTGRKHVLLNKNEFAKPYAALKGISIDEAKKSFDDLRTNFKLDISGFVEIIKSYLGKQPKNSRIVFCVDEVGQFIAEDVRLMLSLQTLAESLAVSCKNQAFLFVTSQNDLNATIGNLEAQQAHDFSRIQGRFTIKCPLTGSNADEVIQKRLLSKNDDGNALLSSIYNLEKNNLPTLFGFTDNSKQYTLYKSEEHFQLTYPFIPYQFDLFQAALKALSDHNAFVGKQQSVGERSMLGVFQQVAKATANNELGTIASFAQMYDGIRDILQSNIQSDIFQAERSLGSVLGVEILKALFLVKYVKGFHATIKNITTLLLPSFTVDLAAFQKQVQEALNLLENQTYVQRVADTYEYLTNQEKDVENEIKNTDIDPAAPGTLLAELLFDEILRDTKVRLDSNNQIYEFGKKIDDNLIGRDRDFFVNFITPLNPNAVTTSNVAMKSIGSNDLIVHLPDDKRLLDELRLIVKTLKYISTNNGANLDPAKSRILSEKSQQNQERRRTLLGQLKEMMADAKMYMNGSEITDIGSRDPKTKITVGVQQLIKVIYTNLKMLTVDFNEEHLKKIIDSRDNLLFTDTLSEVEIEIINRISRNKSAHERTTTKNLLDFFAARPYGWYQVAILCIIAKLYKRNKISIKQDSNILDGNAVLEALSRNNQFANTLIDLEEEISNPTIQKLKSFYQEYFNEANLGIEPKDISRLFKLRLGNELQEVNNMYILRSRFKFLEVLGEPLVRLKSVAEKEHPYFFTALPDFEDNLLDDKEQIIDPIKKFMNGFQKEIFENVILYLDSDNANFNYIDKAPIEKLSMVRESKAPYMSTIMQEAKQALEEVKNQIAAAIKNEKEIATTAIQSAIDKLKSFADFDKLNSSQQQQVLKPLEQELTDINTERFIGNIRTKSNHAVNELYQQQLELMSLMASPPPPPPTGGDPEPPTPKVVYVPKATVKVPYKKPALETKEDVEEYIKALKEQYLKIIAENKRISL